MPFPSHIRCMPLRKSTQTPVKYLLAVIAPSLFFLCTSLKWRWRVLSFWYRLPHSVQVPLLPPSSASGMTSLEIPESVSARFWRWLDGLVFFSWFAKCIRKSPILSNNWVHRQQCQWLLLSKFLAAFPVFVEHSKKHLCIIFPVTGKKRKLSWRNVFWIVQFALKYNQVV